jgi:hypothetical protein
VTGFLIWFFSGFFPVPVWFRFLGSTGSMTGSVLITLIPSAKQVYLSTILQVVFYSNSPRTLLQQSWLNHEGQLEEGKRKRGIFPLMLSPLLHFQQGQLVFHLLEVGLQQQVQRLKNMHF